MPFFPAYIRNVINCAEYCFSNVLVYDFGLCNCGIYAMTMTMIFCKYGSYTNNGDMQDSSIAVYVCLYYIYIILYSTYVVAAGM